MSINKPLVELPPYPSIVSEGKKLTELNFHSVLAAGAYITLLAGRIPYTFRVIEITMNFDIEHNNLVEYRWFYSGNNGVSTTGWVADFNLLGGENPNTGFIGKGQPITRRLDVKIPLPDRYIKMAVFNGTAYQVYVQGSCLILEE